jgi:hypothetical protein
MGTRVGRVRARVAGRETTCARASRAVCAEGFLERARDACGARWVVHRFESMD